jgi:hypothetical protein
MLSLAEVAISKAPSIKSSDPKVKTFGYTAGGKQPQTVPAFSAKRPSATYHSSPPRSRHGRRSRTFAPRLTQPSKG